jgi:hypothetical protein
LRFEANSSGLVMRAIANDPTDDLFIIIERDAAVSTASYGRTRMPALSVIVVYD